MNYKINQKIYVKTKNNRLNYCKIKYKTMNNCILKKFNLKITWLIN